VTVCNERVVYIVVHEAPDGAKTCEMYHWRSISTGIDPTSSHQENRSALKHVAHKPEIFKSKLQLHRDKVTEIIKLTKGVKMKAELSVRSDHCSAADLARQISLTRSTFCLKPCLLARFNWKSCKTATILKNSWLRRTHSCIC
jgi:hypothetical protein